jgi:hypothetical protein
MTELRASALPIAGRRLDAQALPWWLCVSGMATGLLMVFAAEVDGTGAHGSMGESMGAEHGSMAAEHADAGHHLHHLLMIVGLTLIMMSPFVFPLLATVARTTLWWEATPAVAAAWAGFLGIWCVAAAGMHLAGELMALLLTSRGAVAALTVTCVAAQLSRRHAALLGACALTRPMRPGRPVAGGLSWGAVAVSRCIRVCAAPMTLMALSPGLGGAAAITALLWWERFSERRLQFRIPLALGYLAVGAALLIGVSL